jgi:hypothetical protein
VAETLRRRVRMSEFQSTKQNEKIGPARPQSKVSKPENLDDRYGKIGIPAVAAALRYAAKRPPRKSSSGGRIEDRFVELAA